MKKPTRDELIAENAKLKTEMDDLARRKTSHAVDAAERDQNVRKELSQALGAPTKQGKYGYDSEEIVYSWFEIFREIGKLLEQKKRDHDNKWLQDHEQQLQILRQRFDELTNPKDKSCCDEERPRRNLC